MLDNDGACLPRGKISAALCDTPYARTFFNWSIVNNTIQRKNLIYYVDIDTLFSAYVAYYAPSSKYLDNLIIFKPRGRKIADIISNICSTEEENLSLVVIDSVSLLYELYSAQFGFGESTRIFSLYLAMLKNFAIDRDVTILVTSLARSKKSSIKNNWKTSYPGGRSLDAFSSAIFSLQTDPQIIEISVLKHPNNQLTSNKFMVDAPALSKFHLNHIKPN